MAPASDVKGDNPDQAACAARWPSTGRSRTSTVSDYKDVEITKDDGGIQLHVATTMTVPYIANVSLSVHFDKTVKVQ